MRNAKNAALTTTKPETTFEEMLNIIGVSLSDLASSDDQEDGEHNDDHEEDHQLRKFCKVDEPSWVMGSISKVVQHRLEHFRQRQIKLDEMTQPGWGDAANSIRESEKKYSITE